jgi:uncharacterized membrane protein
LGWTALVAIVVASIVIWETRKTRAGRYLQDAFIVLVITGVVAAIALS